MITNKPSTHAVISNRRGTQCGRTNWGTYVENCHLDTIFAMFDHFYPNMISPGSDGELSSRLEPFSQVRHILKILN